ARLPVRIGLFSDSIEHCGSRWQAPPGPASRSGKRADWKWPQAALLQSDAPAPPVVLFGAGAGFATGFGLAGFASALSEPFPAPFCEAFSEPLAAASGLAAACFAGLFGPGLASLASFDSDLTSPLASAEASGFFRVTLDFLSRWRVCSSASAATAAINAAPVRVGPV